MMCAHIRIKQFSKFFLFVLESLSLSLPLSIKSGFAISATQGWDRYLTVRCNGGLNQMRTGVSNDYFRLHVICNLCIFLFSSENVLNDMRQLLLV